MDESRLDELNHLHDSGKLGDAEYHDAVVSLASGKGDRKPVGQKTKMAIVAVAIVAVVAVVAAVVMNTPPTGMSRGVWDASREALSTAENAEQSGTIYSTSVTSSLKSSKTSAESSDSGSSQDQTAITAIGQIATGSQVGSKGMVDSGISMLEHTLK